MERDVQESSYDGETNLVLRKGWGSLSYGSMIALYNCSLMTGFGVENGWIWSISLRTYRQLVRDGGSTGRRTIYQSCKEGQRA